MLKVHRTVRAAAQNLRVNAAALDTWVRALRRGASVGARSRQMAKSIEIKRPKPTLRAAKMNRATVKDGLICRVQHVRFTFIVAQKARSSVFSPRVFRQALDVSRADCHA